MVLLGSSGELKLDPRSVRLTYLPLFFVLVKKSYVCQNETLRRIIGAGKAIFRRRLPDDAAVFPI